MNNLERRIQEQRTIDAIGKNLMGFGGKLALISKTLGSPIRDHFSYIDESFFSGTPDSSEFDEEDMPVFGEEESVRTIGYVFDGLSIGKHIEITANKETNKIVVSYKGYVVYSETNGTLDSYAPFIEWESLIDYLYKQAQNKAKQQGIELAQQTEQQNTQIKDSFLKKLRMKWGI